MSEWNAIDLHLHTAKGITRDGKSDNVVFSYDLFATALASNELKLISITNHNIIDIVNLILVKFICTKLGVNVLTGVEFDTIIGENAPIHLATIFDTSSFLNDYFLSKTINDASIMKKETGAVVYNFEEIQKIIKGRNSLLIPHGDKDRGVLKDAGPEIIKEALIKIKEGFIRVFDQYSDWKMSKIKKHLDFLKQDDINCFNAVLFSDNRDWSNYNQRCRHFFMCAEPTFKGLLHATTNPTKRFSPKTEIILNRNYISRIEINSTNDYLIKTGVIKLSPQYNCIIGKSGSGKSLLINLIKKSLSKTDAMFAYKKYGDVVNIKFYNENNEILTPENINITEGVKFYEHIIKALDSHNGNDYSKVIKLLNPDYSAFSLFKEYKDKYENTILEYINLRDSFIGSVNGFKSILVQFKSGVQSYHSFKDIISFSIGTNDDICKSKYSDENLFFLNNVSTFDELSKVNNFYKGKYSGDYNAALSLLREIVGLIKLDIETDTKEHEVITKRRTIINDAINKINNKKSAQAKLKYEIEQRLPSTIQNLADILVTSYILQKKINSFDLRFDKALLTRDIPIDFEEDIHVKEMLDSKQISEVDIRDNELFETYGFKGQLSNEKYSLFNSREAKKLLDKYIDIGVISKDKCSLKNSFLPQLDLFFGQDNVRELNPGSIAKKYIEVYFKNVLNGPHNIILFDQIENDVDKQFIAEVIVKLLEQTKGKTQLIVVTHDPIVAVNADPNKYIKATRNNDQISYRDFVIESSINDEVETISQTVDGSRIIIKNRYIIYGDQGENYDN